MANRIDLSNILINFLKKARYERHIEEGTLEENQFYAVTDGNEKTEYGDLFGNIENQADLYNALYASRLFKMEMCNDVRGYAIVHKLYNRREFDLSKFTVVGNPTITEDGIIDTTSITTDYVKANFDISTLQNKSWHIRQHVHLSFDKLCEFAVPYKTYFYFAYNNGWNSIVLNVFATTNGTDSNNKAVFISIEQIRTKILKITPNVTEANLILDLYYDLDKQKYYFTATYEGVTWKSNVYTGTAEAYNSQLSVLYYPNGYLRLGQNFQDLKQFSITVDGEEVLNGIKDFKRYDTYTLPSSEVITIPYIPSVDGVKIVDVAYKPLVDQLYTETGMGNYIIIDETNKTFRLPLPDIYSQIEKKTSFTLRKWED